MHLSGPPGEKRYLFEAKGGGAALFDYDGDGLLDLFLVQGSTVERARQDRNPHSSLYRNLGNGRFEDVSDRAGILTPGWGMGVAAGDYDNDGHVDLYITQFGDNILYRNNGDGTFTDRTRESGAVGPGWSSSAAFGDYDGDGDLDLYVCGYVDMDLNRLIEPGSRPFCQYRGTPALCGPMGLPAGRNTLYRNEGDGTFRDVTAAAGLDQGNYFYSLSALWTDLDDDGDVDLLVGNDSTPNNVYINRGDGTFEDFGLVSGLATSGEGSFQASMGLDSADFNNDGRLDVFMTHFANDYNTLYLNHGDLWFEDVTHKAHLLQAAWLWVSWGTRFADFDHDGWKDLFHANGHVYPFLLTAGWSESYRQPSSLYLNQRDGTFRPVDPCPALAKEAVGRGVAFGDLDNDGDWDIVRANLDDSPQLLRNDLSPETRWVTFLAQGRKSNRDGLGTRITVEAGTLIQTWEVKRSVGIYSSSDPRAHFGLGGAAVVDRVRIRWPSGLVQEFRGVTANRHYLVVEGGEPTVRPTGR